MNAKKMLQISGLSVIVLALVIGGGSLLFSASPVPCALDDVYDEDAANPVRPAPNASAGTDGRTLEALFGPMPEKVTERGRSARVYTLGRGISFHMCWCWGVRVLTYDPEEDFNGWQDDRFTFWQDPDTRNLIITDNAEFVAFFDIERDITSTLAYDGTRSHRFRTFSVYFFSNGDVQLVTADETVVFRDNWKWQTRHFGDESLAVTPDYVMELDDRFMQLIGFNFFELGAWNAPSESMALSRSFGFSVDLPWLADARAVRFDESGMTAFVAPSYMLPHQIRLADLIADFGERAQLPPGVLVTFDEAVAAAARAILDAEGVSVDGLAGYMHLEERDSGMVWWGWFLSEELTQFQEGFEFAGFTVCAETGEVLQIRISSPENPVFG